MSEKPDGRIVVGGVCLDPGAELEKSKKTEKALRRDVARWRERAKRFQTERNEWKERALKTEGKRAELAREVTSLWFQRIALKKKLTELAESIDTRMAKVAATRRERGWAPR